MRRDDANTQSIGAALRRRNRSLVKIIAVTIELAALIEKGGRRIANAAIIGFAMVGFDANVFRIDRAEMNARA